MGHAVAKSTITTDYLLQSLTLYDPRQSEISLWLSATAYCTKDTYKVREFLGPTAGFIVDNVFEYEIDDVAGFVGVLPSDKSIYIAFRGTRDLRNWMVNLNAFKTNYTLYPQCECEVHKGFYDALEKIKDQLIADVLALKQRYPTYKVKVTGHSLGAALAQLFAMNLIKLGIDAAVYNFGQPRVGDVKYAMLVDQKLPQYFRVTHDRDTVPHVRFCV
jgi:predicted lipase